MAENNHHASRSVRDPFADVRLLVALPDRAAREAALLGLPLPYRDMVAHFLMQHYAVALAGAAPGAADAVRAEIPESLVAEAVPLARSYWRAAKLRAARAGK